jgi:hypothetical protein
MFVYIHILYIYYIVGARRRRWLRQYPTGRKVADSIIDEVIRVFISSNPCSRIMVLPPLIGMSTRNLPRDT